MPMTEQEIFDLKQRLNGHTTFAKIAKACGISAPRLSELMRRTEVRPDIQTAIDRSLEAIPSAAREPPQTSP